MNKTNWTPELIAKLVALRKAGTQITDCAVSLGVSVFAISNKLKSIQHLINPTPEVTPGVTAPLPTFEEDLEASDSDVWRKRYSLLVGKYNRALHEVSVTKQLVEEIKLLAPTSYDPLPPVVDVRPRDGAGSPQSAVLLFSDTHVGKVVAPAQTLDLGQYDFDTFLARLKYLEESTISILKNHTPSGVDELVIAMLGDMLDGALGHGVEAGQQNTLFTQFFGASHAIAQFFRNLAAHVPVVRVHTVVGNHTRWQNQKRMPTENRFSNLDMFLYAMVQALTADIPSIKWNLDMQPFSIFDVKGFTFHAAHGDHLRGGDKNLGIPNHAIGREVSTKTQLFAKNGRQSPHYYLTGHLHRSIQIPHALGAIIINGGFPGIDNYALMENFNPVDPTQHLMFVHHKYGRTASYDLSLKFASVVYNDYPYTIPKTCPAQ